MLNILLDMPTSFWTDEVIKLVIYYGVIFLIILLTLILMGVFRRKTKREMHPEKIKKACIKAKKYAEYVEQGTRKTICNGCYGAICAKGK